MLASICCACRFGYRALRRFARACHEHHWILQADIRLYFPSIDHLAMIAQLERRIACPGTLWLLAIFMNGIWLSDSPSA
jgi:hypothetical protein